MGPCTRLYTYNQQKSTGVYMSAKSRSPVRQPKRPRNAAATREAILQSALTAFAQRGYDGVGVREIAQTAGVTAVLVNRYFGSKEGLFAAAVEAMFADSSLFEGDASTVAQRLAALVVKESDKDRQPNAPLLLLLRSAPNASAAEILRDHIARHCERPLKSLMRGPKRGERAAIILALIVGLQFFHKVIGNKALADANGTSLSGDLKSMLERLIDISACSGSPPPGGLAEQRDH
jgi:AcrR family transcriptional regulator